MNKFFDTASKIYENNIKTISWIFILLILATISSILSIPNDYYQGISFKIIFLHVPSAWLSLSFFAVIGICSIIGLVFKLPLAFMLARIISPIGFILSLIVLYTGSIWGYLTWGVFWVWDARLTSMLILAFIYLGHILLLNSFDHFQKSDYAAAILAIIGLVNLPIVKFSVDWWTTVHQVSSVFKMTGPSMSSETFSALILSAFTLFAVTLFWLLNQFFTLFTKRKLERIKLFQ